MSEERTLGDGRYRLEALLGKGGMSEVYKAFDTRIGVHRAVKVLNPELAKNKRIRERFENEAFAMAKLAHPNILLFIDVGPKEEESLFLVMELADGGSLADRIRQGGPLSPQAACDVALTLLPALDHAHKQGIIHRDIKPENLLVDQHGTVKIADFGIARVFNRSPTLTRTGSVMGTWAYMSPEQRENAKAVDGRADVYALGCTLFFLVSGREPFDLHNTESHERVFEGIPQGFADVIKRATRYRVEDRFPDATAMVEAIRAIRDAMPTEPLALVFSAPTLFEDLSGEHPTALKHGTLAPGSITDTRPPVPVAGMRWVVVAGGAVALGVAGWFAFQGSGEPTTAEPFAPSAVAPSAVAPSDDALRRLEPVAPPPEPLAIEPAIELPAVEPNPAPTEPAPKPTTKTTRTPVKTTPAPVAVAAMGKLQVTSNKAEAVEVLIDDVPVGTARRTYDLASGAHVIVVRHGEVTKTSVVEITEGKTAVFCWNFEPSAKCP